ncbi:MAG: hypothetical protein JOY60_05570 [Burkholderiaceae bacterium]|nr:hypothetical protein [Burkholderiaceae bacterium]
MNKSKIHSHSFSSYGRQCLVISLLAVLSACGGGSGTPSTTNSSGSGSSGSTTSTSSLAVFAGTVGGPGSTNGTGAAASFNTPNGMAVDASGNVYVADTFNQIIRKITPAGLTTTLAGTAGVTGSADGTGAAASFRFPTSIAVDSGDNLYVTDAGNNTIRKITPAGVTSTLAGTADTIGSSDGTGGAASFDYPYGIAIDGSNNLYVTDYSNSTVRKVTPAGVVTTLAGSPGSPGSVDGTGRAAQFIAPTGIALDSQGNLYVADYHENNVRKITPAGVVTTLAGQAGVSGHAEGSGSAATFSAPLGLAVDASGNVFVADSGNNVIRKISSSGVVTLFSGSGETGGADGSSTSATFNAPFGLAIDASGNLYVSDSGNDTVRKVASNGSVSTLAGSSGSGSADGAGAIATFNGPNGLASDSAGNVYVADRNNNIIRKISPAGVVSTLAGTAGNQGSSDGASGAASFFSPTGVAVDSANNVYVADFGNNTVRVISSAGVVTTLAGSAGTTGSSDGTGSAARFNAPYGVAVDSSGNVYVTDSGNDTVRKITPAGVVSTLAGTAGHANSTDGMGSAARFSGPTGIVVDGSGNLYVTDFSNYTVRKISAAGVVSTLAGTANNSGTANGSGSAAQFYKPSAIALDGSGNLYVADTGNDLVRKITPAGSVSTVAGTAGTASFNAATLPASLLLPSGVAISGTTLYIATGNAIAVVANKP